METFKEFEPIVLIQDLPDEGLASGDVGTIVDILPSGKAFCVEFFGTDGHTITVTIVEAGQARLPMRNEILHARPFDPKFEL